MAPKKYIFKITAFLVFSVISSITAAVYKDSGTLIAPTTNPNAIFMIASGSADFPNALTMTFSTNTGCPVNFTPYITVTPYSLQVDPSSPQLMTGFTVCVQSIVASATDVSVTLLNDTHYKEYQDTSKNGYYGTDSGGWTVWSTKSMPDTSHIDTTMRTSAITTGHYLWAQYCYPSGMTPPPYVCP